MLTRFFAAADYDMARLLAWMRRIGFAGFVLRVVILVGLYSLGDCAYFVWKY